jgi:hypothetical protein
MTLPDGAPSLLWPVHDPLCILFWGTAGTDVPIAATSLTGSRLNSRKPLRLCFIEYVR